MTLFLSFSLPNRSIHSSDGSREFAFDFPAPCFVKRNVSFADRFHLLTVGVLDDLCFCLFFIYICFRSDTVRKSSGNNEDDKRKRDAEKNQPS